MLPKSFEYFQKKKKKEKEKRNIWNSQKKKEQCKNVIINQIS